MTLHAHRTKASPAPPRQRAALTGVAIAALAGAIVAGLTVNANAATNTATRPLLDTTTAAAYTKAAYFGAWTPQPITAPATPTFSVGQGGTFPTVQASIDAALQQGGTSRIYIAVTPGIYREVVCVPASAPPITLYGTDPDASKTVIVFNNANLTPKPADTPVTACNQRIGQVTIGTSASATFSAHSNDFQAANLTFSNDYVEDSLTGPNQSAVALGARGDQQIYSNVHVLGNQDTLMSYSANATTTARQYFTNSYVEGDTDYVFGRGTAVFEGVTFKSLTTRKTSGAIFAPSTAAANQFGYLVIGSTITSDAGTTNTFLLGRAWDEGVASLATYMNGTSPNGQLVIRESTIDASVNVAAPWGASTVARPFCTATCTNSANRFFEFANTGPGSAI